MATAGPPWGGGGRGGGHKCRASSVERGITSNTHRSDESARITGGEETLGSVRNELRCLDKEGADRLAQVCWGGQG